MFSKEDKNTHKFTHTPTAKSMDNSRNVIVVVQSTTLISVFLSQRSVMPVVSKATLPEFAEVRKSSDYKD